MKKSTLLALTVPSVLVVLAVFPLENEDGRFHTHAEIDHFRQLAAQQRSGSHDPQGSSMIDSSVIFLTSKSCSGCHGQDENMVAFMTSTGEDVNIHDDWRSTMMANSAKDPFWRAKVTHEMLVNPAHSLDLQDKCTSCHAPAGHYQAKLKDHKPHYLLADLYADTLGLDGVTCQACHAQSPDRLGSLHSGELHFDTNFIRVAYGPYKFVFEPPMRMFVGITPLYGEHIGDAGLCAGCHTLITQTVDLQGDYTGDSFVEQATYHEWLNSRYDKQQDNISCQNCHMKQIDDAVVISSGYQFLFAKFPFGLHELAGANVTMLKLMKQNRLQLGIDAEPIHFDSTIAATLRMLQQQSVRMKLDHGVVTGDSLNFSLQLSNLAGHKFPSGYPARRAWVEFELKNEAGQTLFHSGKMAADYSLPDEDPNYEPHYNRITSPDQVQIYEMVPIDVTGAFTNVLERGFVAIKDNRLVPQGFKTTHPVYDTTKIVGVGNDPDFNRSADGTEGAGADILHFRIPGNGYTGRVSVRAKLWYQSLPPKWMAPMFEYSSPEIDAFRLMFDAADRSPVLVAEAALDSVFVSSVSVKNAYNEVGLDVFPTLSTDGRVNLKARGNTQVGRVQVWDSSGRMVWDRKSEGSQPEPVQLPRLSGYYFIVVETNHGRLTRKVLRQ